MRKSQFTAIIISVLLFVVLLIPNPQSSILALNVGSEHTPTATKKVVKPTSTATRFSASQTPTRQPPSATPQKPAATSTGTASSILTSTSQSGTQENNPTGTSSEATPVSSPIASSETTATLTPSGSQAPTSTDSNQGAALGVSDPKDGDDPTDPAAPKPPPNPALTWGTWPTWLIVILVAAGAIIIGSLWNGKSAPPPATLTGRATYAKIILERGYTASYPKLDSSAAQFNPTSLHWKFSNESDDDGLDIYITNGPGGTVFENHGDHVGNYNFRVEIVGVNAGQYNESDFAFMANPASEGELPDKGFGFIDTSGGKSEAAAAINLQKNWLSAFNREPISKVVHELSHVRQYQSSQPIEPTSQATVGADQTISVGSAKTVQLVLQEIEGEAGIQISEELANLIQPISDNTSIPPEQVRSTLESLGELIQQAGQHASDDSSIWMKSAQLNTTGGF